MEHEHVWRMLHEEFLLGGSFLVGWECTIVGCEAFVSKDQLTPTGIPGKTLKNAARLVGPHGGSGYTSDGKIYREQILDEDGNLTVMP